MVVESVALRAAPKRTSIRYGWTVLATVLITVAAGLVLAVRILNPAGPAQPSTFGIGDDVRSSFGIVAVEFVRKVDGVSHRALSGSNHGVQGYVDDTQQQIQVAVALTNRLDEPLAYSVRQFKLYVNTAGKTAVLNATAGDLPDGRIQPDAGIEGHLDFTVPAAESTIALHFVDPGSKAPVVIDLGNVTAATPAPDHTH